MYKPPWFYNPTQSGGTPDKSSNALGQGIYPRHMIYVSAFYLFLGGIGAFALLKVCSRKSEEILDRPLAMFTSRTTMNDLLLWAWAVLLLVVWLWCAIDQYLLPLYQQPEASRGPHDIARLWGLAFSQLCNLLVGLVLLPITKHRFVPAQLML